MKKFENMSQYILTELIIWKGDEFCVLIVKTLNYCHEISKFEFQQRYYIWFQAITLGKGMDRLVFTAMS